MNNYVFGPVPSRRLDRSLGVDLVPFKTCPYDCVYCQLGRTTCKTIQRREWVPLEDVFVQLSQALEQRPDYITLSGSGEPTLHRRLGILIRRIKTITDIPIAVLTSGSLLWDAQVREEVRQADLVIPSLDAGDERTFRRINRPHDDITFDRLLDGLIRFRQEFTGQYWLEVFVVAGVTDNEQQISRIADYARDMHPDLVQLNTAVRPSSEHGIEAVGNQRLEALAGLFHPPAEVVADYHSVQMSTKHTTDVKRILTMLQRRPCTAGQIADGLGTHPNEVSKLLGSLIEKGQVQVLEKSGNQFFQASV
jgi:wyosine [tRNA(Phe)-imidazoG37] synthetase (radical SAM superfamily)